VSAESEQPAPWDRASLPSPLIPLENTFEGFLGLEWLELTPESAHVRFEVRENLKQPLGLMHGGIYSAVAETVASVATVNNVWKDGYVGAGLSNYASFLRPITGGAVDVIARLRGHDDRVPRRSREAVRARRRDDRGQARADSQVTSGSSSSVGDSPAPVNAIRARTSS